MSNPIVTIEMENGGVIRAELYPEVAPNTVRNFVSLVQKGFYDGTIFHRVIPGFMIQGGDPEGTGMGGPGYEIRGEFTANGFQNDLNHTRGVLSMARTAAPDSAGSQFFIMTEDAPHLDGQYASFGMVIDGMDIVDAIVNTKRDWHDRPREEQKMKSVTVDTQGVEYEAPETRNRGRGSVLYYTNKETFVLSADGCMDTERGGLESILAGNDEGAKGCCFSVAMSADGIAVLSSDGCVAAPDGTRLPVRDYSYAELHQAAPQLTPVSQAIELARTCQGKIAITVHDQTMLRQLRMTLRYADCLDDTIIIGLGLVEAARVASANPDLHIMGEMPNLPSEIDALVNAAQTTGLFGLRAEPKDLSERLVSACRQAGLFTMSRCTDDPNTLAELIRKGVNFIETRRPDITAALLPAGEAEPHGIPLRY